MTPPELARTVTWYVPAGVPVAGLTCAGAEGPDPTAPQAIIAAAAASNNPKNTGEAKRGVREPKTMNQIPASAKTRNAMPRIGRDGRDTSKNSSVETAECAVVEMESVTCCAAAPGVIVADGEKAGLESGGGFETLNVTG